jgi:hypothetical protein
MHRSPRLASRPRHVSPSQASLSRLSPHLAVTYPRSRSSRTSVLLFRALPRRTSPFSARIPTPLSLSLGWRRQRSARSARHPRRMPSAPQLDAPPSAHARCLLPSIITHTPRQPAYSPQPSSRARATAARAACTSISSYPLCPPCLCCCYALMRRGQVMRERRRGRST